MTAVGQGRATITVTATAQGGATQTQTFTVTVPEPEPETPTTNNPSSCQSPLTIKLKTNAKCKVPSKATLDEPRGGGLTVAPSSYKDDTDVWVIRAHSEGTYTVTIYNGAATPENIGEITVVVPNSPPVRNNKTDPTISASDLPISDGNPIAVGLGSPDTLDSYFDDADDKDDDPDTRRYSIGKNTAPILIDAKNGFVVTGTDDESLSAGSALTFDALEKVTKSFQVTIYAHDESAKSLDPVVLTFTPPSAGLVPRRGTYSVIQTETGKLTDTPKVGARIGVPHTLVFENTGSLTGFQFSRIKVTDLQGQDKLPSGAPPDPDLYYVRDRKYFAFGIDQAGTSKAPYSDWTGDSPTDAGTNLYILRSTGVVEAEWPAVALSTPNPSVSFKLTGKGSGSITVEYYIWSGAITGAGNRRESANSGRLTLNIIVCNSPPNPITDCPLTSPD